MKATLTTAGNAVVPAYLALLQRGLSVYRDPTLVTDSGEHYWIAELADLRFVAEDLMALMGLVALYETRGTSWQASDEEIDQFVAEFGAQ